MPSAAPFCTNPAAHRGERIDLGPVGITASDMPGALQRVETFIDDGGHHTVCFCEANLLSHITSNPALAQVLEEADAVFADGVALTLLARLRGQQLPGRVAGPWFFLAAMEYGVTRGWRHYFYGGAEGVAETLAERMRQQYPGVQIAGTHSPPFRELSAGEEASDREMIESAKPHLLWVGLGGPKQEFWIQAHRGVIDVPVMLAVGAAFDFHSGNRAWAPKWVRALGFEWAFRMLTGGRRTLIRNLRCVTRVAWLLAQTAWEVRRSCPECSKAGAPR